LSGVKNSAKAAGRSRGGAASREAAGTADHLRAVADFEAAMKLFARKEFARARELFRAIPEKYAAELEIVALARSREAMCERRVRADAPLPSSPEEQCDRGVLLLNEGDVEAALDQFRRAAQGGGGGKAQYLMACALSRSGRPDEALEALRRAIDTDPFNRARASNEPDFEALRLDGSLDAILGGPGGESA
jgi:tetratricopeptide (TPR) repeat protein